MHPLFRPGGSDGELTEAKPAIAGGIALGTVQLEATRGQRARKRIEQEAVGEDATT
jgi:hypothetical protein